MQGLAGLRAAHKVLYCAAMRAAASRLSPYGLFLVAHLTLVAIAISGSM
jgi:hypothetical protein